MSNLRASACLLLQHCDAGFVIRFFELNFSKYRSHFLIKVAPEFKLLQNLGSEIWPRLVIPWSEFDQSWPQNLDHDARNPSRFWFSQLATKGHQPGSWPQNLDQNHSIFEDPQLDVGFAVCSEISPASAAQRAESIPPIIKSQNALNSNFFACSGPILRGTKVKTGGKPCVLRASEPFTTSH